MRSRLACALAGAVVQLCLPLAASAQTAPAGPPREAVAPVLVPASGAEREAPDVGLEGGGNAATCRPVFSPAVARIGPAMDDPEKEQIGSEVQRVECGPG